LLHRRKRYRRNGHVGITEPVLVERGLEPEMTGGGETVDADNLALETAHRSDRRAFLDEKARAEPALALARDRGDEFRRHPFGGGEDDAVGAADRQIDRARFERLSALVRAHEAG